MTFTELSQALFQFWSQFAWDGNSIPAYRQGHVPDDAELPYITFRVSTSNFGGTSVQSAFIWCRHSPGINVNAQRADILDQVAQAIPVSGKLIRSPSGGGVWLQRNADFLSDYEPPDEYDSSDSDEGEPIIGGRISYTVKTF